MFGRPRQSVGSWERELSELLAVCDDHVSLYQLTLERGTQLFKQVQRGEVSVPPEEEMAEMYQRARTTLQQHGFLQYEVSNFARHVSAQKTLTVHPSSSSKAAFLINRYNNMVLFRKITIVSYNIKIIIIIWDVKQ